MPFDGEGKSFRRFVPPFFKRALWLEPVKSAIHFYGREPFRAEPEPLFLRRVAVESIAPVFVIPPAGADVCFAGHRSSLEISKRSFGTRFWEAGSRRFRQARRPPAPQPRWLCYDVLHHWAK